MALPLIYAAGATVARFIAEKGLKAAAKKYTKKAIAEGKKHAKDMVTKPNAGQKKIKPVQAKNRNSRSTLRKGVGAGTVAAGGVGTVAGSKLNTKLKEERSKPTVSAPKESPRPKPRPSKNKATKNAPKTSSRPKARPSKNAPKKSLRPKIRPVDKSPNAEMNKSPNDYKKKK